MLFNRRFSTALAAGLVLAGSAGPALVHPHVFAEARLEVTVNPDDTVKAMRNLWRFDDLFSSTVLMEFDKNADLKLDAEELQDVADTIYQSLAEFNYFQMVTEDGKDVALAPPPSLLVNFEDQQLIVVFESAPKEPLKLDGKLAFGVYDPTFYTAIDFIEDDQMAVAGMPGRCTQTVVRPDPDEILEQNQSTLTDAFFNDPAGTNMSKIFATRLELTCGAEG
jgi:ABC-type uncharacterized transport system substrate-binding protein